MQMLYNSVSFTVVAFEGNAGETVGNLPVSHGGYEIVDKFARKGIFIQGELALAFQQGVEALVALGPDEEALDDYIAGYTWLAQHPVVLH